MIATSTFQTRSHEYVDHKPEHIDECFCCGRGLTQNGYDNARWIHLHDGGTAVILPGEEKLFNERGDLGLFPIGIGCYRTIAKRLPNFRHYALSAKERGL